MEPMRQNEDGSWEPAKALGLLCEHPGCKRFATVDCKRRFIFGSLWNKEPEALCEQHSQGRKVLHRYQAGETN